MKYAKIKNGVLSSVLKKSKFGYSEKKDRIEWTFIGFDPSQISALAVQYTDANDDCFQFLPISDEAKFNSVLPEIKAELTKIGGADRSIEIVEDDRENWLVTAKAERNRQVDPTKDMSKQEKRNYVRNKIIEDASVIYKGVKITASSHDIAEMDRYAGTAAALGVKISWKAFNTDTDKIVRIDLDAADFQAIKIAVFQTGQIIHIESDTKIPINPWPIKIEA